MAADRGTLIFKSVYYTITAICIGAFIATAYMLYRSTTIPGVIWFLFALVAAIYFVAAFARAKKRRGIKRFWVHSLTLQLLPLCAALILFCLIPDTERAVANVKSVVQATEYEPLSGRPRDYERSFNDMQKTQKAAAEKNGLAPFKSQAELEKQYSALRRANKLVHIATNPRYVVRELTSSSPYVVPKMARLLDDIAVLFQKYSHSNARFMITSVLRTEEDIKNLRRVNRNASTSSCHCNATTVDISYVRFDEDSANPRDLYQLRLALAKSLHELRKEGRCYVKIEKKQYCYHITVR